MATSFDETVPLATGLTLSEIAKMLGMTPQSISVGIKRAEGRDTPYFNPKRIASLYAALVMLRPDKAAALRKAVVDRSDYRTEIERADHGGSFALTTPFARLYADYQCFDIFNLTPKELRNPAAERVLRHAVANGAIDIAFFHAPDTHRELFDAYKARFGEIVEASASRVIFFGHEAFRFLFPSLMCSKLSTNDYKLFFVGEDRSLDLRELDGETAEQVVKQLISVGIRYVSDWPFEPRLHNSMLFRDPHPLLKQELIGASFGKTAAIQRQAVRMVTNE